MAARNLFHRWRAERAVLTTKPSSAIDRTFLKLKR